MKMMLRGRSLSLMIVDVVSASILDLDEEENHWLSIMSMISVEPKGSLGLYSFFC